jgi:Peptidase U49
MTRSAETEDDVPPKDMVIALMRGVTPERDAEIVTLWERYNPRVCLVKDEARITLNANKDRIAYSYKTMEVFWLIGFAAWKAIECYSPCVVVSALNGRPVSETLNADDGIDDVELSYRERLAAARALIDAPTTESVPWPTDIPRPTIATSAFADPQFQAAFDLTCISAAFAFFHEFKHVMLEQDGERHADLREEELACDVWARQFMTARLSVYADDNGHPFYKVLEKRAMGLALAALILHEITPVWDRGGNRHYFSVTDRIRALVDNTALPERGYFWVFVASLLIGIFRHKNISIGASPMSPRDLAHYLLERLSA